MIIDMQRRLNLKSVLWTVTAMSAQNSTAAFPNTLNGAGLALKEEAMKLAIHFLTKSASPGAVTWSLMSLVRL
jgi:hypothetical protein